MNRITDMSWKEIRSQAESGALALLATGSAEQHGLHLPVETDSLLVTRVAEGAVTKLEGELPIVLAPTLWLGASHHHQQFFALSVDEQTYISMVIQLAASFAKAGFRRLFILNGHGGNSAPLRVALTRVREQTPELLAGVAEYWGLGAQAIRSIRTSQAGGAAHGGELETSLVMHLKEKAVRTDNLNPSLPQLPEGFEIDLVDRGAVTVTLAVDKLSRRGSVGATDQASAAKGKRFFDDIVEVTAETLLAFARLDVAGVRPES